MPTLSHPSQLAAAAEGGPQNRPRSAPFLLPGCGVMFDAGAPCYKKTTPFDKGCCPSGFSCERDAGSVTGSSCLQLPDVTQSFSVASARQACSQRAAPSDTCGSASGPDESICCPDGFVCRPEYDSGSSGSAPLNASEPYQPPAPTRYSCQANPTFQPLGELPID